MKWLKGKEDHPVPFLAVSPGWCCCCVFFFWLLMMGGFEGWETLQNLVWGVLSCFGACVFCLCQNLFTLPETSTGTQKGIKPEVLVSVWWLVRACPWAPGCFETPTFFERSPVSDDEKHTNTIAKDAVVFEPTWKNIRLHFVAFYSVFFPKEWMLIVWSFACLMRWMCLWMWTAKNRSSPFVGVRGVLPQTTLKQQ